MKIYKVIKGRTVPQQYEEVQVKDEGHILGNEVFVAKDKTVYRVYDKKTGYTLSGNYYKTIKNAIESEYLTMLGKVDGNEQELKRHFENAYKIASERGTNINLN